MNRFSFETKNYAKKETCPVNPALVVVKFTSHIILAASGAIYGVGFLVVRYKRKSSL